MKSMENYPAYKELTNKSKKTTTGNTVSYHNFNLTAKHLSVDEMFKMLFTFIHMLFYALRERSGSVVEYLTRDGRVAGSSLTGVTTLWSLSKTHLF